MSEITNVKDGYNRWSAVYDTDGNPMQALEEQLLRPYIEDVSGLEVLDLGCGTGRYANQIAMDGGNVTALDFSEGMLAVARSKPGSEQVKFLQHDLHERLPLGDKQFDLVISGLVLEHLRELPPFFKEFNRVLRVGGTALVSAMHPAMFLRNSVASFEDPSTGELVQPGSIPHQISDMVMAILGAQLSILEIQEQAPDSKFVNRFGMKESSSGWPMVAVFQLSRNTP